MTRRAGFPGHLTAEQREAIYRGLRARQAPKIIAYSVGCSDKAVYRLRARIIHAAGLPKRRFDYREGL